MSLEKVASCPVCAGTSFTQHVTCKDYTATNEWFHVEQCATCHLLITNPRPNETMAAKYYQSTNYISHTAAATGLIDYIYLIIRYFTLHWKFSLVKKRLANGKLLDFGCGTGSFLNHCIEKGIDAYGIEPSVIARDQHSKIRESLDKLEITNFDVITLWHVLEHVYSLDQTLDQLKERLSKNGTIFIAVPNWQCYDEKYYKANWAAYDVPRHIWHFQQSAMKDLLNKKGLKLHSILPMKLDSYYVSLLSEKNSNGGKLSFIKLLQAIRIAFLSNHKAKKDLNYSSLIYVATK